MFKLGPYGKCNKKCPFYIIKESKSTTNGTAPDKNGIFKYASRKCLLTGKHANFIFNAKAVC